MHGPLTIRTVSFVLFAGATGISTGSRSKPYARWCARCRTTWTTISAHCIQRQGARRSRKTVAEHAAAAVVRCAERTATDGWPSPDDVYQASRKIAARRSVQSLHGCAVAARRRHDTVVGQALLRQQHAGRGAGWPQNLQAERRYR